MSMSWALVSHTPHCHLHQYRTDPKDTHAERLESVPKSHWRENEWMDIRSSVIRVIDVHSVFIKFLLHARFLREVRETR